jgi:hypothetical protein
MAVSGKGEPDPEMGPSLAPTARPMELGACTGYSARRYRQAKAPDYCGYLPFEPNAATAWVLEQKTAKGLQERGRFPGQEFV